MEYLQQQKQFNEDGYIILRNFFTPEEITMLKIRAEFVFYTQFTRFRYSTDLTFEERMIKLFTEQEEVFKNCGKMIQTGLPNLYKLAIDKRLEIKLTELGVKIPFMCTRPVMYFNHPKLAKSVEYYKTPMHQDWPSMESSLNSVVCWFPLVNVNKENGSIKLYPGSHKNGVLPNKFNGGFAEVEYEGEHAQPDLNVGDIVIFSTLLVHESGEITNNQIRWSSSFRFTDMSSKEFIERGCPNLYQYIPVTKNK